MFPSLLLLAELATSPAIAADFAFGYFDFASSPSFAYLEVTQSAHPDDYWQSYASWTELSTGRIEVRVSDLGGAGGVMFLNPYPVTSARAYCQVEGTWQDGSDEVLQFACYDRFSGLPAGATGFFTYVRHGVWSNPAPLAAAATLVADHPTSASYVPSTSYNSRGGVNRVTRTGTGTWRAFLPSMTSGGVPLVQGYGTDATWCKVSEFHTSSAGTSVGVRCMDASGGLVDASFALAWVSGAGLLSADNPVAAPGEAWGFFDDPTITTTTNLPRSYNSLERGPVSAWPTSYGGFYVDASYTGGCGYFNHAYLQTAVGDDAVWCYTGPGSCYYESHGPSGTVCYDSTSATVDSSFTWMLVTDR